MTETRAAAPAVEFELKLCGRSTTIAEAFERLDAKRCAAVAMEPAPPQRLSAVYYDTTDRRLLARRAALRVRREGEGFVQALKIAAGALDRLEHEAACRGLAPDLDLVPASLRPMIGAVFPEELVPVFATDVVRRRRDVVHDDGLGRMSRVEIALDLGEITAGTASEPISELEIELKEGDRAFVFDVAQSLVDAGASRLMTRPKAARGYALADGTMPAGVKARTLRLARTDSVGDALERVFDAALQQWLDNHDAAFDGRDAEGVHQLRIALRRLRSALTLFAPVLAGERLAWLKSETRWLMGVLGHARDLDVFVLEMLPPIAASRANDAALAGLRSTGEDERARSYDAVRTVMSGQRYTRLVLALGQWIAARGWYADADAAMHLGLGHPLGAHADHVLERRARSVRKRGRHFDDLDVDARHEVRKALKKLRYAADFFRGLYPGKATRRYLARLSKLQDAFGHMNDMAAAEQILATLVRNGDSRLYEAKGLVLGYYAHAGQDAESELRADWRGFEKAEPFWSRDRPC